MEITKDYAFASGGIIWKIFDRGRFQNRSLTRKLSVVFGLAIICWVPLALLSYFQIGWDQFRLLFIRDIATHVRFLLVLPILLIARQSLNISFNKLISIFYESKIVDQNNEDAFQKAMDWLMRWRGSGIVDVLLIALVYSSFYVQESNLVHEAASSYTPWLLQENKITAAGWWYLVFCLPFVQLLLYRWLYTILLWIIFLYKISKIDLHLSAFHPDGMGGLGFLNYSQVGYAPVAFAFSALPAGSVNNMIIFSHTSIQDYKMLIASILILFMLLFTLPLLVFVPLLLKIKRKCFLEYSLQAWDYTRMYEEDLKGFNKNGEEQPDASGHVDLIDSFEKTASMKVILIDKNILVTFLVAVALPYLAILAQEVPLKVIFETLISKLL